MQLSDKTISVDKAWDILFDRHNIADRVAHNGSFRLSAAEINTVKDARAMVKFDQSIQLPRIFRENGFSLLPITRDEYVIGSFTTHVKIPYEPVKPKPVPTPDMSDMQQADLYSESSALQFAYKSGIIQDIMRDKAVYAIDGRTMSGSFSFRILNPRLPAGEQRINVVNVQTEIDAGYESRDLLCLCEAKNVASEELFIRRLYYPYRLWSSRISKPVLPIYLVYSNDVFHAFLYRFDDKDFYNSIQLVEHRAYTFAAEDISLDDIIEVWHATTPLPEPNVTFPQADSFSRIVDILSVLYERRLAPEDVTLKYDFDARQTSYYVAACEYLDLIVRDVNGYGERQYALTKDAKRIMEMHHKQKYLALIGKVLQRKVFYHAFGLAVQIGGVPDKESVCAIMREMDLPLSDSTIGRRSSTVRSWLDWIFKQITVPGSQEIGGA